MRQSPLVTPPLASETPSRASARYPATLLLLAGMSICIVLTWYRNHDILRDMFDYSTVVSAAGKVESGFRPYVGTRSPMQSSIYLLNYWTEQVFGRNYLALTWGGLIQALGGAWVLRWLLRDSWGAVPATGLALAVAMAGLVQHVVFFYNPIGILCLGVVVLGLAAEPTLWPLNSARRGMVLAALFLGGINKLNFHGATLAVAGLLILMALAGRRTRGAAGFATLILLALAGLVLPLVFELGWTGATLAQWWNDVVRLPQARYQSWGHIFDPDLYFRPVYEFHHHILLRPIGAVGLLFLVGVGSWAVSDGWREKRAVAELVLGTLLIAAGAILSALLMVTNHETVVLTSLSYLLIGSALHLYYRPGASRWRERVVWGGVLIWAVVGGYASWHGSRVLYAPNPPERSSYVRLDSRLPALAYFRNVRMQPDQIDALERVAAKLQAMEISPGHLPPVLFGPALEWLERYYVEATAWRAPIWYDAGTSLTGDDERYFEKLLDFGHRRLITHQAWQAWPPSIWQFLGEHYRAEVIGSRDVIYHPRSRTAPPAVEAVARTITAGDYWRVAGGNVLVSATRPSANMELLAVQEGRMFGASGDTLWSWPFGARELRGEVVAQLAGDRPAGDAVFRVIGGDSVFGELIWETEVRLDADRRTVVVPFSLVPGNRPLWLQTEIKGAPGAVTAGWRELRITYAGALDRPPALPTMRLLEPLPGADIADDAALWFGRKGRAMQPGGWVHTPVEHWRLHDPARQKVRVKVEFESEVPGRPRTVNVMLAWYRAGRFEIMAEHTIDLRHANSLELEGSVLEAEGWVGLLARSPGAAEGAPRLRVLTWELD